VFYGMIISAVAIFWLSFLDPKTTALQMTWPLMLFAAGLGGGLGPLTNIATQSVPQNEMGVASAILNLTRNIAGAVSIAIFSTLLSHLMESHVISVSQHSILNVPFSQVQTVFPALVVMKAQVVAYGQVFLCAAAVMLVGAFLALFLEDIRTKQKPTGEATIILE